MTPVSLPGVESWRFHFERLTGEPRCIAGAMSLTTMEDRGMTDKEEVPFMQRVLDNYFLLVILGVVTPTVLYTIWGIVDIISVPLAK
ncbi:MAG: hypothetical protein EPN20_17795 [Magnetospirillum sp.]|nr:MAG: hypothetical protein EPN20_17795 [Magnetospirillum sp.]